MSLFRPRFRPPSGNIEPCLPRPAKAPPTGADWIHEIKHDGFRILARRDGPKVRLISRHGRDLTYRFRLAASAVAALPVRSCLIDGEAIVCDGKGVAVFQFIRNYRRGNAATLFVADFRKRPNRAADARLSFRRIARLAGKPPRPRLSWQPLGLDA
jgi:ATP-dependent DNA ligase